MDAAAMENLGLFTELFQGPSSLTFALASTFRYIVDGLLLFAVAVIDEISSREDIGELDFARAPLAGNKICAGHLKCNKHVRLRRSTAKPGINNIFFTITLPAR